MYIILVVTCGIAMCIRHKRPTLKRIGYNNNTIHHPRRHVAVGKIGCLKIISILYKFGRFLLVANSVSTTAMEETRKFSLGGTLAINPSLNRRWPDGNVL